LTRSAEVSSKENPFWGLMRETEQRDEIRGCRNWAAAMVVSSGEPWRESTIWKCEGEILARLYAAMRKLAWTWRSRGCSSNRELALRLDNA